MNQDKRYRANPNVSCADEEDGAVLFHADSGEATIINPTGRVIWGFIQNPCTAGEIVARLAAEYEGAAVDELEKDVTEFLQVLLPDFVQEAG